MSYPKQSYLVQTIEDIFLDNNAIGEVGVCYLAEAIKSNQVTIHLLAIFVRFIVTYMSFGGPYYS